MDRRRTDVDEARGAQRQLEQEPSCRWAHGVVAALDTRGLCAVCAEGDQ